MRSLTLPTLFLALISLLCTSILADARDPRPLAKAGPGRHTIVIEGLKYKPDEIEVSLGDTVVWVNKDDRDHMVKAEDGSFESGRMGSGKSFEHKFDKAGKFRYGDDLSPRMHGTITVKGK